MTEYTEFDPQTGRPTGLYQKDPSTVRDHPGIMVEGWHPGTTLSADAEGMVLMPDPPAPPSEPGAASYAIAKDLPWRRMTDAEAATMETVLAGMSPRLRQIYAAASIIRTDDELFDTLRDALAQALTPDRANELLAPSWPPA